MTNFNNKPFVEVKQAFDVARGWASICQSLNLAIQNLENKKPIVVIETYQGVIHEELVEGLQNGLQYDQWVEASMLMKPEEEIRQMVYPDVTDDRIFGYLTRLNIDDYFDEHKVKNTQNLLAISEGVTIIYGTGASLIAADYDLLVYADMARWEIQLRMRKHEVDNVGVKNRNTEDWMLLYKQGFFVDWRACDRLKKSCLTNGILCSTPTKPANQKWFPELLCAPALSKRSTDHLASCRFSIRGLGAASG